MDFDIGKQISTFFKFRKLAILLIVLIILFSILGTYIPQKSQLKAEVFDTWEKNHRTEAQMYDLLGFNHIYSSFIFICIAALLFINTLFCTKGMFTNALRRSGAAPKFQKKAFIGSLENNTVIKTEKNGMDVISSVKSVLLSHGYTVSNKEHLIFAEKNNIGVLGTPLFHISILFLMLAVVYGSTGRMEGDMRLIEGQTLSEEHGNYMFINEGPFFLRITRNSIFP